MAGKKKEKGTIGSGRPSNPPKAKMMLKHIIPVDNIFNEEELRIYNSLIDVYLKDFDEEDLSASDMDDIMSLAMNKVLEVRLLTTSKDNPDRQIDISQAIERLRKQSEKTKENLSTRRKDRIDPNEYKGFSIVDLAVAFDQQKRGKMEAKARELRKEQEEMLGRMKDHGGNRYDRDGNVNKSDE